MFRIAIMQDRIPRYRVPVFERLGAQSDVDLTVYADAEPEAARGFRLEPTPAARRFPRGMRTQPAHLDVVEKGQFDLVILPWYARYLSLGAALRRANREGTPVVLWRPRRPTRGGRLRERRWRRLGQMAQGVLVCSRSMAEELGVTGFDQERVFVVPNAIDQRPIVAAQRAWTERAGTDHERSLESFRAEHGLDPAATVIVATRLEKENRPDLLLIAHDRVRRRVPEAKLVVIGDGSQRKPLEGLAEELDLVDHVVFAGGIDDEMDLAPWMMTATLFADPACLGLNLFHAFGYGLPVVTADVMVEDNPELDAFVPDRNGLLHKDGNVGAISATWLRLLEDGALRTRMSENARRVVNEVHTLDAMVQGLLDATRVVDGAQRVVGEETGMRPARRLGEGARRLGDWGTE